ncbi:MAG: ankyrin repeat domain-containing protein [Elusimicrobiota bacterium]
MKRLSGTVSLGFVLVAQLCGFSQAQFHDPETSACEQARDNGWVVLCDRDHMGVLKYMREMTPEEKQARAEGKRKQLEERRRLEVEHANTRLWNAIQGSKGVREVEEALIGGADANLSHKGTPVLVAAADIGDYYVVNILLSKGAKPDAQDADGSTALMRASARGHTKIVELLEYAANR